MMVSGKVMGSMGCNISNKSASSWPEFPDTDEKQMKARGRRYLETPVKHDARVFDVASKTIHTSLVIRGIVSVL